MVVLLPSPLLGPAVWYPVAAALGELGWSVRATGVAGADRAHPDPTSPGDVLAGFLDAVPADTPPVLTAHSNAGLFVPALVRRRDVVATVFVDAGLPPADGPVPLAPPALLDFLAGMADQDGTLPGWTDWWDDNDVDALFPSAASRRAIESEQRRLPLSYFTGSLPADPGWDDVPGAHLAFGDTYDAERTDAQRRGWPVVTMDGHHLHTLVAPEQVAATIETLLAGLGVTSAPEQR